MKRRETPVSTDGLRVPASALRRTLSLVRPHVGGQGKLAAGGLAGLLLVVLLRLLEPWPVKFVIDAVVPAAAGLPVAPGTSSIVIASAVAVVVITAGRAAASYLSTVAFALVGARVTTKLRAQLYEHLLRASLRFHERSRGGDLVTRVVGDVGRVQEAAISAGLPLVGNVLTFTGMAVVMLVLDPFLALAVLAVVPLFLLSSKRASGNITGASRSMRKNEGRLAGDAGEAFGAVRVVQAYGLESHLAGGFAGANEKTMADGVKARRLAAGLERRTDVVVGMATGLVLAVGAQRVLAGSLSPGDLVVFLTYLKNAFKPMRDLAKYTGKIARAVASGERVADAMEEGTPLPDRSWARPLGDGPGDLRIEELTVAHEPGRPVLREANLRVRAGERLAVVGPSGAGKSTLLQVLLRFVDPDNGTVRIDGHDVADLTRASVRDRISVVLQESVLFAGSLADNIRLGRPGATDADVIEAAGRADAHEFISAMPDGYDTLVGERGSTLSGGQRQRVAVARAILRNPALVLLDEPTTGLDSASADAVLAGLRRLTDGRTTLLITHDPKLLEDCDRVVELRDGRFFERTPPLPRHTRRVPEEVR